MNFVVPPGGLAGFAQMAPASRRALFSPGRAPARSRGRKSSRARAGAPARRRAGASAGARAGARKLKFGSPAWQKKYRVGAFSKKRRR